MKLRNEKTKTGHLLSFISKEDRSDNFSLFFQVEALEEFDTLLEVIEGFEKCLEAWAKTYSAVGYSISEQGDIEKAFSEIDVERVFHFEQSEFLSETSRFIEPFGKALLKRFMEKHKQIFPNIVTGAMAVESSFYDRETAIQDIWALLKKGDNILFRAPRRFGKTSLLNHISSHSEKGWQICFVDLEGGDSSERFVEKILTAMLSKKSLEPYLPDHLTGQHIYAKTEIERLEIHRQERKAIHKDWKKYAEALFTQVENKSGDNRFLFILDEVSFLIEDMMELSDDSEHINELLTWFGEIRKQKKKIQFILSGSEHLPSFLSAFGIDSQLEDLEKANLGLFEKDIAREFIFLTLAGQKVAATIYEIDLILELMGKPIPYFLHLFLDVICRTCKEKNSLTNDEIISVYYDHLLGSESKRYFESITRQLERYKRYGIRNMAGAKSILDILAINENPVKAEELKIVWKESTSDPEQFNLMLDIMQDDFYLSINEEQQVSINSRLIKDWWQKYGVAGLR